MTREVDGLGVLVAIPEHCRRVMVSFLSLEGLGNLRRVSKAFLKIVARTPQWQWDAALTRLCNVNQKVQCMNCYAHPSELTAATCEECEEVMLWPNADPRFSEGFRLLSAKEKFCTVYRHHRRCLGNLRSFYDLDDFTAYAPNGGWSTAVGYPQTWQPAWTAEEDPRNHRVQTLQHMNESANPERHVLMVDLMFLSAAQKDIGHTDGPCYYVHAFQGIQHVPNSGSSFREMINCYYMEDFLDYLPGSDEHIRALVTSSINHVDRVASGRRTATSTSFWGQFSRIAQLHPTPHAPCAVLYLVPMLIGC